MRTSTGGAGQNPAPERDLALTGSPAARTAYREIATNPVSGVQLDVVGPGGCGKTTLLAALAELYQQAKVTVIRQVDELPEGSAPADAAILIDDAHELDDAALDHLRSLVSAGNPRLVVAHRPWPSSPAMAALGAALTRTRPPVVLGALDRAGVAGRMAMMLGARPTAELVDRIAERTAGMPSLLDRVLRALRTSGAVQVTSDPEPRLQVAMDVPPGLLEQLRYDVVGLPSGVGDLLLAIAVGAPLDGDVLAPTLELPRDAVSDLVEGARAAGLLGSDGKLAPLVRLALLRHTPSLRVQTVRHQLAEVQLERGGNVLAVARGLLGTGASGARIAALYTAAGDDALRAGDPLAREYYAAAVQAGAAAPPLAARRAQAAAAVGDFDPALTLADQALSDRSADADWPRAVAVAASVAAQRGMLARTAELYRWLAGQAPSGANGTLPGPGQPLNPAAAAAAVPALLGTGALDEARDVLAAPGVGQPDRPVGLAAPLDGGPAASIAGSGPARPPTLLSGAEMLIARGIMETVIGSSTAGLSQLARAAALLEPAGPAVLLPDTPAALAALVALQCGELDVAKSVLDRAVAARLGGPAAAARHRLLQAWIAMQRGATAAARTLLNGLRPVGGRLEPRDEFFAAALEVALARRAGDLPALMTAWGRAREGIVRYPVDLYALQPLGELVVGAARLREQSWVQPHLIEAHALLVQLGEPPLWAAPVHWSGLQAAIVSQDVGAAELHAAALEKGAGSGRYVAAMATAARLWLRLLADDIDAAAVEAGARALHAVGLTWEGGRLAGQAAIRTRDRKDMTALLSCARALQGGVAASAAATSEPAPAPTTGAGPASGGPPAAASEPTDGTLSEREREVAELVLSGLTYKQIGEQLFISAKTVEHHVARMRQRLGSGSRGELFAHLRSLIGAPTGSD